MATFTLTSGPDTYINYDGQVGSDPSNTWLLGSGEDHFEIYSNWQNNVVDGYWGSDTILVYGSGQATVNAGDGSDYIRTDYGNDIIHGQLGNDNIDAGWGSNVVYGDDGNDTLNGAGTLIGGLGDDTLYGSYDGSVLQGSNGNDKIYIQSAISATGGVGNDYIQFDEPQFYDDPSITLGTGRDTLRMNFDNQFAGVRVDVWDLKAEDTLRFSSLGLTHAQVLDVLDTNNDRLLSAKDVADQGSYGVHLENSELVLEISDSEVAFHGIKSGSFDFFS